jgi:superfamily II DNA/RNA helicase
LTRSKKNLAASVQAWYGKNLDHGASLYFRFTRPDPGLPNFADRWSLCEYICSMSPKLRYLCKILGEALYGTATHSRGKLLVFVTWPIEQWLVCCLLQNLGIDCMSINSGMSAAEKARVTDRFDDISDPCPVLVCTFRGTAFGINLQRGCSKLLMMGFPENINTLLQTIGRIHRLGQNRVQEIWVLGTDHTYDQMLQAKAVKKMVVQMLGEADLEQLHVDDVPRYKDNLRQYLGLGDDEDMDQILAELRDTHLLTQVDARLTRLLGMRCSRLTWDSKDLYNKDGEDTQQTPHRIRMVPVSDHLSSSIPIPISDHLSSSISRGKKRPYVGTFRNYSFYRAPFLILKDY